MPPEGTDTGAETGAPAFEGMLDPAFFVGESAGGTTEEGGAEIDLGAIVDDSGPSAEQIGRVVRAHGTIVHVTGLTAHIGQRCRIVNPGRLRETFGDVVGISDSHLILFLLSPLEGLSNRSEVHVMHVGRSIPFSESLTGCILDGTGRIVYRPHEQRQVKDVPIDRAAPDALTRIPITRVFATGVKAIDTLLTIGEGQRVGIFASAGGGKSTLLGMLARHSSADVIVIGLIGERGREVREFIEHNLGPSGLARSVLILSTSDRPAMERVNAAQCATTVAEGFRARGHRVLLLMDSVTRYARALREIGLSVGEPPARRGFPPSVFAELPRLLERSGNNDTGSITAFYTVLAEDEETSDPVAEEVRSILDGHLILSRALGERGHYPPIDVLASASRLFRNLVTPEHERAATRVRRLLSKYAEVELLVQMGEYREGTDPVADEAIARKDALDELLRQAPEELWHFDPSVERMMEALA